MAKGFENDTNITFSQSLLLQSFYMFYMFLYAFRLFGASGRRLVRRRRVERYHQSCLMPTVKHPEIIQVWGCFSVKGVGSLTILPKSTAMNKDWYQKVLREQLLPTIRGQFVDEECLFQHDGAPCHKAKVITKWLKEQTLRFWAFGQETPQILIP